MKKGEVKRVTANGTWEGKFGVMYKFEIEFTNGDVGEYSSKSLEQTKFKEGEQVEYEFVEGKFPKVKPFYAVPIANGSFTGNDNTQELIVRQCSLKAAVEYSNGSTCSPEDICDNAELFAKWIFKTKTELPKTKKDDLPF